ncbi:unnamed protein product [Durusdinium trenchii]
MRRDATFPKPNVVSFNATLSAYARGVAWASSMALLEDMYTSKVHPDRATLGACVSALEQSRCWQQVLLLLSDSRMVEPDLRAWNASMSCCTRAEAWPHALQLFHKWRERLTPNEISYNTALNAWERGSHWAPVLKLFQEMLHREVPPDVVTFNTTIAALQWERWELGLQHFDLLRHRKLRPNVVTLGTIIGACGRGLQWQRALHFFWQGDRYGDWAPNEVAVVSAMTACKQSGRWLEALQLFQDLGRRSLQQNVVSHSAAIAACAKAGQFEQVELLLQQMHEASVRANAVAFTAALRLPSLSWQRALELFRIMEAQCIETDAFAFHRLVKVCQIDSIWEEAVRAFVRMCEKHEPRADTFTCALSACQKATAWEAAVALATTEPYMTLAEGEVERDLVASACLQGGQRELASQLFRFMEAACGKRGVLCSCGQQSEVPVIAQSAKLTFLDRLLKQLHAQNMGINDAWRKELPGCKFACGEVVTAGSARWWRLAYSGALASASMAQATRRGLVIDVVEDVLKIAEEAGNRKVEAPAAKERPEKKTEATGLGEGEMVLRVWMPKVSKAGYGQRAAPWHAAYKGRATDKAMKWLVAFADKLRRRGVGKLLQPGNLLDELAMFGTRDGRSVVTMQKLQWRSMLCRDLVLLLELKGERAQVKRLRDTLGEPFWTLCDDPQHTSHSLCDFAQVYDRGDRKKPRKRRSFCCKRQYTGADNFCSSCGMSLLGTGAELLSSVCQEILLWRDVDLCAPDRQAKLSGEKKRKSASAWLQSAPKKTRTMGCCFGDLEEPKHALPYRKFPWTTCPVNPVLIFCQYISTLDLLESYCAYRNWRTLRMDGATSRVLRELDMRDFNSHDEDKDLFVYLIGTRAGGLGDWNPHVDHQAIDRAHRIGQTRQEWGIEERLVLRATSKLQMERRRKPRERAETAEDEEEEEFLADSEDTLSQEEAYQGESLEDFSLQELLERERRPAPISDEGLRSPELEHQVFQRRAAAQRAEREMCDDATTFGHLRPPPESSRSSSGRIIKSTKTFVWRPAATAEEFQAPVAAVNRKPKVVLKHFLKCFVCTDGCEAASASKMMPTP